MKPFVHILYILNIVVELFAPVLILVFAIVTFQGLWLPIDFLVGIALIASLVTYPFYVWVVVEINRRRFPRVHGKAIIVTFAPLLFESGFLLFWDYSSPYMTQGQLLMLALVAMSAHLSVATYIAILLESVQGTRVRAFTIHRSIWNIWLAMILLTVSVIGTIGFILWVQIFLGPSAETLSNVLPLIVPWLLGVAAIVFVKYHRSGRTLYAEKGYRPNAAIIVTDGEGQVLLCERSDRPGTIQTVQGGIDPGETPEEAASREMGEELGVWPDQFIMKAMLLDSKAYEWEEAVKRRLKRTGYVGQQQYFFLAEVDHDTNFDLDYHHREFRKVWWGSPEQLLRLSWSKKRPGIEMALKGFGLLK
jgi:putative (di)nucleoside polyphosphate hydrolase